uniref:Mediator complex subunit Med5 n=1 Tax=Pyxicephalus adspersus TaxID=30357 RepID=A0A499QL06_PYXAD|nr:mediator complex subunit Med5 [Pyxicephalus adspersus]
MDFLKVICFLLANVFNPGPDPTRSPSFTDESVSSPALESFNKSGPM